MDIRRELGIGSDADKSEIRRAYARRLKETHPEDDPEGFQRLRAAYEAAMSRAESAAVRKAGPETRPSGKAADERAPPARANDHRPPPVSDPKADTDPATETAPPQADTDDRGTLSELMGRICGFLDDEDEDGAIAALDAAMGAPVLLNLANRRQFELWLLEELGDRNPAPLRLVGAAIDTFGWDGHWTELPGDFRHVADRVIRARMADDRLAELRRDARATWTLDHAKTAAWLLLGKYRPILFSAVAMVADTVAAMAALLNELRTQYPSILERDVDPRVLAWWAEAVDNPNRTSGRAIWIVIAVSFSIGVLQVFTGGD